MNSAAAEPCSWWWRRPNKPSAEIPPLFPMIRDAQQHMRRPEAVYNFRFPVFSGHVGDFVLQKFSKPDALLIQRIRSIRIGQKWKLNASTKLKPRSTILPVGSMNFGGIFDVDRKARRLEEVNREIENPDLWNDPKHAQEVSKEKKMLDDIVGSFQPSYAGHRRCGRTL